MKSYFHGQTHPLDTHFGPPGAVSDASPPGEGLAPLQHVYRLDEHDQVEAQHQRDGRVEEHLRRSEIAKFVSLDRWK